jgi:uncharacterized protein
MQWLNEPASWQRNGDVLRVSVDPGTDFWRTTGYGYVRDNGHVYGDRLPGDLDVSVRIRGAFASQYDQAGIMLRADQETWLKAGLEFFEGRLRLSTVLTMGHSSWMVADLPAGTDEVTLRASRRGDAVEVRYAAGDGAAELAALVFMPPDRDLLAGIMCAAPEGTGFSVAFHDLRVVGREWGGPEVADGADWAGESAARADGWVPEQAAGTGTSWDGEAAAWEDERPVDTAAGWASDTSRDEAGDWAGDKPGEAAPSWAGDRPGDRAAGWAGDTSDDRAGDWARDKPAEAAPGLASGRSAEGAGRWAQDKPGEAEPDPVAERPAGKSPAGVPDGWADELPGDESLDWAKPQASESPAGWAKPQASESAADWDRLSESLSTTSWNAFAAAQPPQERTAEPALEQPRKPAADTATGRASEDRASEDRAGGQPEPLAGGRAGSVLAADDLPGAAEPGEEPANPDEAVRGKNARGRNKAKLPVPPALPPPADPADEWISLLTADSAEELSGSTDHRADSEPAPG